MLHPAIGRGTIQPPYRSPDPLLVSPRLLLQISPWKSVDVVKKQKLWKQGRTLSSDFLLASLMPSVIAAHQLCSPVSPPSLPFRILRH